MARTILLADDSVTIQKVVELTFLDEDFRVVCHGNGADAIAALAEVEPDVVLADVHMPGADGYELCAAAQEVRPGTPVLLLVGTFEVFDAERAKEVGARGHLKKPFDSQELLQQVRDLAADAPAEMAQPTAVREEAAEIVEPVAEGAWDDRGSGETVEVAESVEDEKLVEEFRAPVVAVPDARSTDEELESAPAAASEPSSAAGASDSAAGAFRELSDADVDRIARRVVELIGDGAVRDVAWEVVPDLAELLLKSRIRELEASVE